MVRSLTILLLITAPALAWEATSSQICELFHEGENASVLITYDPGIPEYSIAITPQRPWQEGPVFAMRFEGPQSNTIRTNRHVLSGSGATLTVTDSGFGNVLSGLEFNHTAIAMLGDLAVNISLENAAQAVRDFRACTVSPSV